MNIRRYYVPNAIVFVTQVVSNREPVFQNPSHLTLLRDTMRRVKELHPFHMLGYVFLPDHFHLLFKPTGNSNFSIIMHSLKSNFTMLYKSVQGISGPLVFWQKGFWDHIIRNEEDLANHLDYIHYNPVHHALVAKPEAWPHSSFGIWKQRCAYADTWGWSVPDAMAYFEWRHAE